MNTKNKIMRFTDRKSAGKQLADVLFIKYKGEESVVYGLPRGGVVVAFEVAKKLKAPLDLIITRKIGHKFQPEYAIAAVSENGHVVGNGSKIEDNDKSWFENEVQKEKLEAQRRREVYLKRRKKPKFFGKIAIIVDDGIATGLTILTAISEIKQRHPKKIVVASPVGSKDTVKELQKMVDKVIILRTPSDFYAIGAFYDNFEQVTDEQVTTVLTKI